MKNKKCRTCGKIKPTSEYYKDKINKDGLRGSCKECGKKYNKLWRINNTEHTKQYNKKWYKNNIRYIKQYHEDNAEHIKKCKKQYRKDNAEYFRQYNKQWCLNNFEKHNRYKKVWAKNNPEKAKKALRKSQKKRILIPKNRLSMRFSYLIWKSLKGNKNGNHWESLVNYNLLDLMAHLENKFKPNMSWDNYGKWHVDHIIPISLWKFNSYNDREFSQAWSLANLQPLWGVENLSKSNRTEDILFKEEAV